MHDDLFLNFILITRDFLSDGLRPPKIDLIFPQQVDQEVSLG